MTVLSTDLYVGLSGLALADSAFDLGHGITIRKTYAQLFSAFMAAFEPAVSGKPHSGPWKAARGGFARDITSEVHIPQDNSSEHESQNSIAWAIVFALRLGIDPGTELTATSNHPFSEQATHRDDIWISPVEVEKKQFPLSIDGGILTTERASWIASRWPTALTLINSHAEFSLAVDAMMTGQYVQRSALTLVSLWAALEAIFSPSNTELKFRVSSLIAAYLEPPGESRRDRAKAIGKLYDKRSSAAHGRPSTDTSALLDSFNLMRSVLIKILDEGRVPTKETLEMLLYGTRA